jgi:oxygen-independent coproporphyrinogen-3 oxidase
MPYDEPVAKTHIDALCQELYLKKDFYTTLKTIYIGGGTPSLLPDECFKQLFICLKDNFSFSSDIEITAEANPGTINESKINTVLSLGVNRLSIGIQSFNNDELKTLGRIHSSEDASRSIEIIKKEGINNFSVDLMYGVPGQTIESWHNSISTAVELSPTHISTYELTVEENTLLYKLIQSHKIQMLDEELILEMYNHAIDYFASCGYEHYEISNFALPGFRCVHNLNYWDRGEYIGAGAGAHSFINGIRSNNTEDITRYIEDLNNGIIPETESAKPISAEALKEFIFLGLRKTEGININELPPFSPPLPRGDIHTSIPHLTRGDIGGYKSLLDASKELIDEGYIEIERGYLRLTRKGIVISNTIIVKLFERLGLD